jgi:hypothetical protein
VVDPHRRFLTFAGSEGRRPGEAGVTGPAPGMRRAVVLFTRDLRLQDNPVLDLACRQAVPPAV